MATILNKLLMVKVNAQSLHRERQAKNAPRPVLEAVELSRACAVFDQFYIVRYIRREESRLFTCLGSVQLEAVGGGQYERAALPFILYWKQIDPASPDEQCAWCGAMGKLTKCYRCDQWVCSGRLKWKGWRGHKPYFRCRDSCGNAFYAVPCYPSFDGSREQSPSRPSQQAVPRDSKPALPANGNTGALPGADRRRLK